MATHRLLTKTLPPMYCHKDADIHTSPHTLPPTVPPAHCHPIMLCCSGCGFCGVQFMCHATSFSVVVLLPEATNNKLTIGPCQINKQRITSPCVVCHSSESRTAPKTALKPPTAVIPLPISTPCSTTHGIPSANTSGGGIKGDFSAFSRYRTASRPAPHPNTLTSSNWLHSESPLPSMFLHVVLQKITKGRRRCGASADSLRRPYGSSQTGAAVEDCQHPRLVLGSLPPPPPPPAPLGKNPMAATS